MEKFKPTVISKEFISSVTDSVQNQNAISFAESVACSSSLSDDQAMNNNYQKSQSYSRDVTGIVTGYKNADTNTIVANVKISNQSLSADVKISTIMIFANYSGNKILVATSRLNEPELLPAFDADKGTPVTIEVAVYIQVSNVVDAKVQFNEAGLATNSDLQHVDSTSVHNIGNETIDGVKTFTQPIKGVADINVRQLWDGYDIDKLKTTGFYVGNYIKVLQSSVKENFSLLVENAGNSSSVKQTKVVFYQNGEIKTLVRYFTGTWSMFTEVPTDDTRLLHNSGDEAISGLKTFNDDAVFNKNVTVTGSLHANADNAVHSDKSSYADKAGSSGWANGAGQADKSSYADKSGTSDYVNSNNDQTFKSINVPGWSTFGGGFDVRNISNHGWANFQNGLAVSSGDAIFYWGAHSKKVVETNVWDNGLNAHIYRVGNIVVVQIYGSIISDHGAYTTIGWKIPLGFRPAYESHGIASAGYTKTIMRYHPSGDVNIIDSPLKASNNNGGDNYSYGFAVWATTDDFPS